MAPEHYKLCIAYRFPRALVLCRTTQRFSEAEAMSGFSSGEQGFFRSRLAQQIDDPLYLRFTQSRDQRLHGLRRVQQIGAARQSWLRVWG